MPQRPTSEGPVTRVVPEPLRPRPCAYAARAWWGDQLVAESSRAVLLDRPGETGELYFPLDDVRTDLLRDEGRLRVCPVKGSGRLWSADREPGRAVSGADRGWRAGDPGLDGGRDVLWGSTEPSPGYEWLRGMGAFDDERVRVELIDREPGDEFRDVSVKRFPVWGDAADLVDVMDVRRQAPARYVSVTRPSPRRPVVEGSQMLGQAIVAAGRHSPGRRVVSGHMVFLRAADAGRPLEFALEELSAGRTFTTLSVDVTQSGRRCARGTLMLDVTAPDVVRHSAAAPATAGPYEAEPYDMSVMGRDIRVVEGAYTDDPKAPVGPPVIDAWVRFRRLPDDPYIHAGLLAQFTGHMSIAAALRPHEGVGQREAHRTLSTAINAIGISLHSDVRADRWMLYRHESTFAGDGMTHSSCRVHDGDGRLLASFTVDAMVRRMAGDPAAVDDRTAL